MVQLEGPCENTNKRSESLDKSTEKVGSHTSPVHPPSQSG